MNMLRHYLISNSLNDLNGAGRNGITHPAPAYHLAASGGDDPRFVIPDDLPPNLPVTAYRCFAGTSADPVPKNVPRVKKV